MQLTKYRVTYTEIVVNEAVFEGPAGLDTAEEEADCQWWDHLNNDENSQVKRLDVVERSLDTLKREE